MAVVPMEKIRLLTHKNDVTETLAVVQRYGAMEFHEVSLDAAEKATEEFEYADILPRVQHAVAFLKPYEKKNSLIKTLREGTQTELSETEIEKRLKNLDSVMAVAEDVEKVQVELAEITETVRSLNEKREVLNKWKDLPIRLQDLETGKTKTLLLTTDVEGAFENLYEKLNEIDVPFEVTALDFKAIALTVFKEIVTDSEFTQTLKTLSIDVENLPKGEDEPEIELVKVEEILAKEKGRQALVHDQAEHFAITHLKNLQVVAELLSWKRDAHVVRELGVSTKHVAVFEGWVKENKKAAIEAELSEKNLSVILETLELTEGEEPPVEIENNKWIAPFEVVTRLYGMPGHKDLDPTAFLAGFFFLFFGLSLTDVGYGVFLMIVAAGLLFFAKIPQFMRTFALLLFFMGLASALVGLLFGGYLGISPDVLPSWLLALQMFDPIGNPLPVFYLALALGVVQIMVGMLLKIYSEARNGRFMTGLLDQGPWFAMFVILITYLAATLGYVTFISTAQLVNLIYVGIVAIVLASGRNGDTILEKVKNAALSLYDSIGYFSDILSYSRLLALGLATTALAFAVNLIAEIVSGSLPYVGPVLAIAVLVIGHLFTLAVNTLGAFIHSARLQFVEFFGKFISGTGRQFVPLSRTEKHVVAVNDE